MNRIFLILPVLFISLSLFAQTSNDTINQVDNNGKKHGFWKKQNGDTLKYEGRFVHGIPEGDFVYYYDDGKVKTEMNYTNNGQNAYAIMYFNNGKKMAEGKFVNKKREGEWITYDGHDNIIAKVPYSNGKKSGLAIYFFPEGGTLEEVHYEEGIEQGNFKQYFPNGSVKMKGCYENGKYHGPFTYYYPNNMVYNTGLFENGLKNGVWSMYDEEGKIILKYTYNKGEIVNKEVFQKDKDPEEINKKLGDDEHEKKGSTSTDNGINDPRYDGY